MLRAVLLVEGEEGVGPGGSITLAEACKVRSEELKAPKGLAGGVSDRDRTARIQAVKERGWEVG